VKPTCAPPDWDPLKTWQQFIDETSQLWSYGDRLLVEPAASSSRRIAEMNALHRLIAWLRYEWQWQVSYWRYGQIPLPPGYIIVRTGRGSYFQKLEKRR
jgi:hypothetical protein